VTSVRPATESDTATVRELTTRAFADDGEVARLVDALAADAARISLVAELDDSVVGHTLLSRGWVDAEQELVHVLVLSPLSVEPAVQRRGIGGALVRAALAAAELAGAPAVFLEGSRDYYARFGFVAGESRGFTRPSVRIPKTAFQVMVLPAREDWMTGALVYPEAFWATDTVGLRGEVLDRVRAAEAVSPPR
jgi:putative acetyltransferase